MLTLGLRAEVPPALPLPPSVDGSEPWMRLAALALLALALASGSLVGLVRRLEPT